MKPRQGDGWLGSSATSPQGQKLGLSDFRVRRSLRQAGPRELRHFDHVAHVGDRVEDAAQPVGTIVQRLETAPRRQQATFVQVAW